MRIKQNGGGEPGDEARAVAQWLEHLQLKQEALGSITGSYPGFFFLFQLTHTNGLKNLWCSSTVRLLSTQM